MSHNLRIHQNSKVRQVIDPLEG